MDPTEKEFDAPERAFEHANFQLLERTQSKPPATRTTQRSVPTTYADIPSSDSDVDVSPISNDGSSEPFNVTITPPPERQGLSRHNSGLPPTPPTMTNSDIMEPKPERNLSPVPQFADRVRNALESQKPGRSTPIIGNISPPTPGTSPPGTSDNLHPPRPALMHSESSFAESFTTATEGLGNSRNASRSASQALLGAQEIALEETEVNAESAKTITPSGLAAYREHWTKQPLEDSDRSEARVRVKNYQAESDSERERERKAGHLENDGKDTSPADETPPLVTRTALNHRAAFQRLRRPLQPGDELKRPNEALLYGTNLAWQPKKRVDLIRAPKREMSAEFMRNAGLVKVDLDSAPALESQESPSTPAATPTMPTATSPRLLKAVAEAEVEPVVEKEVAVQPPLQEFAPSAVSASITSPPTTAAKQSLEDNNQVYRLIQAENVKRHSAISDGSVQAVVVPFPDLRRPLRHTKKRESLRGDISVATVEQRDSEDGDVRRLRHKRGAASLSPHENRRRVVSDQPEAHHVLNAGQTSTLRSFSAGPESSGVLRNVPARISRTPAAAEEGRLIKQRSKQQSPREQFKTSTPLAVANESRRMTSAPTPQPRPWGIDAPTLAEIDSSPRLRRFSRDERLDKNPSIRRTSLDSTAAQERMQKGYYASLEEARRDRAEKRRSRTIEELDEATRVASLPLSPDASPSLERRTIKTREPSLDLPLSPKRRSLDPRYLHSNGTPFSTSQLSDRTALTEPELCEARGVEIYPHNNKSLLLVQHSAQSAVTQKQSKTVASAPRPIFEAVVEAPDGQVEDIGRSKHTVDSPLINPRAAPEPPVIKFIPPTPNEELERMLGETQIAEESRRDHMQRRPSLKQRMRRFSEGLIEPLPFGRNGSLRGPKQAPVQRDERPRHLSSNWVPNDIWADEDDFSDEEDFEPLPPGGDTSDVVDVGKATFPRKMSKRMPGFRGKGGFLQGNSLGIDRHGTNNRRHHINTRASQEMLTRMTDNSRPRALHLPFGRGTKVEYIGFAGLGARMRDVRRRREEKALEKRRDELRRQIGVRMYHEGRP